MKNPLKVDWTKLKDRIQRNPLVAGFILSILVHLLGYGLWKSGVLLVPDRLLAKLRHAAEEVLRISTRLETAQKKQEEEKKQVPPVAQEIPLSFIEVEPTQIADKQPEKPKFYSTANSVAANPDSAKNESMPEVTGKIKEVARLRDVPKSSLPAPPPGPKEEAVPAPVNPPKREPELALEKSRSQETSRPRQEPFTNLQPATEPARPKDDGGSEPLLQAPPKVIRLPTTLPNATKGSAALLPPPAAPPTNAPPKPGRPRSLASAKEAAGIPGPKMQSDSGVQRRGAISVDAKQTPFGEYDRAFIGAIQTHWYNLLDNYRSVTRTGRVVLEFNLTYDGRITDMRVKENEVGEVPSLMCQRAVLEPAKYPQWPREMQQALGANVRPVTLTFFYY